MRPLAYLSILAFVGVSLWRSLNQGRLPDNPFISIVGYAFLIEWTATPWQLLGLTGSILSLAIFYLVDWTFRKYRVANDTQDAPLADQALRHFRWIERLAQARTLFFLAYCAIVGFHAILVLNARTCWFIPAPNVQVWAEWLYREEMPNRECTKLIVGGAKSAAPLAFQT